MNNYEITFITREDLGEKPFKDVLDSYSGNILSISSIGERQFNYPIKKETRGVYTTVLFEVDPSTLSDLNRKLSLTEEILRFLITAKKASAMAALAEAEAKAGKIEIEAPKKIEAQKEITAPEELSAPEELPEPEVLPEPKKVVKPKAVKEKTVIDKPKEKIAKPEKKIEPTPEVSEEDRLKELDKKLDELLKD